MTTVDLKKGTLARHVAKAVKAINDGSVIVVPMENAYAFICDAFSHDAVQWMHAMRRDPSGTKAQVLVRDLKMAEGIVRNIDTKSEELMKKNWPGLMTMQLQPQIGLTWDLGDNNALDELAIRAPKAPFVKAILEKSGPLATASCAKHGQDSIQDPARVPHDEVEIFFSNGKLRKGKPSTIVNALGGRHSILRQGALTVKGL